jgi:AcrR family transcriptional regulator
VLLSQAVLIDLRHEPGLAPVQERIADAALACVERWGVAKTTLDDVARDAGCSRATIYRAFPGGKDALLDAVVRLETARFFGRLASAIDGARELDDLLVAGITTAVRLLRGQGALQFLLQHEPEIVLPRISFANTNLILRRGAAFAAPALAPFVGAEQAERAAEWVTRLVLSYVACPSDRFDLAHEADARRLVHTFVLPGLIPGSARAERAEPVPS